MDNVPTGVLFKYGVYQKRGQLSNGIGFTLDYKGVGFNGFCCVIKGYRYDAIHILQSV